MKSLQIILALVSIVSLTLGQQATVSITNGCKGSLKILKNGQTTGAMLGSGKKTSYTAKWGDPSIRVAGLTGCSSSGGNCEAPGDYQSLAEMHWDGSGKTWYDVSMVDGYTIPVTVSPTNPGVGPGECVTTNCKANLQECQGNKINKDGKTVACQQPNRDAETNYSRWLNRVCPNAYSWSKDDARRPSPMRFSCNPGNNGLNVRFC